MCAGACDMRTLASAAGRASICACDRPVGASVHPSSTTPASRTASKATAAPDHVLPDTASACTSAADCPPPARSLAGTGRTSAALEKSSRLTVVLFDLAPVARRSRMRRGGRSGGTMGQVVAAAARTSGWTLPPAGPGAACGRLRFAGPPSTDGCAPTCADGISSLHADGRSCLQRPVDGGTHCRVDAAGADAHRARSGAALALAAGPARRRQCTLADCMAGQAIMSRHRMNDGRARGRRTRPAGKRHAA